MLRATNAAAIVLLTNILRVFYTASNYSDRLYLRARRDLNLDR